ncbi:zinc finger BED domain-containing protein 4-like [Paramormyrops kingsleyae]|uniref:zinc finger BED domain-containing protein 4-like n=1 Tax=Paramormyrops kingsleyae TaxID=1676925 RepID=UPI003B973FFC
MKMEELRPKQDCPTRWNSTYYMLKSFIASKNAIIPTLAVTNAPVRHLSQEEWTTVQEMCTILQPFEEVTVELSAESYLTASKVIVLARGLQRATADFRRNTTTAAAQEQQMRRFKGCQLQQQELAVAHPSNSNQLWKDWKEQAVVLDQ